MTYKQIEASRETRLWIGQIIVPAIGLGITIASNPQLRHAIADKFECCKQSIKNWRKNRKNGVKVIRRRGRV